MQGSRSHRLPGPPLAFVLPVEVTAAVAAAFPATAPRRLGAVPIALWTVPEPGEAQQIQGRTWRDGCALRPKALAFRAAGVPGHAAHEAGLRVVVDRPLAAFGEDGTAGADALRLGENIVAVVSLALGEEHLERHTPAGGAVLPAHAATVR